MDESGTTDPGVSTEGATHTREADPLTVTKRLQKRPDWPAIEAERNQLIKDARAKGMLRPEAQQWAYSELERRYPPEHTVSASSFPNLENTTPEPQSSGVTGLGDLPDDWPSLPANASLASEVQWVSANRLRVRDGNRVDLTRALGPAPSHSALSWLETAILFPAKFADVAVKVTATQDDEREHVRREKLAIDEIRELLAEMVEADDLDS